jgi:hypothetical protein
MKTTMLLGNPDDLEAQITIFGTVGEFKRLKGLLAQGSNWSWPLGTVVAQINEVIGAAETRFASDAEVAPE